MSQCQPLGFGPAGDLGCILGVKVGPGWALLAGLMRALCYKQVCVFSQFDCIIADACIRTVGHNLAVQIEAVAKAWRGMHQEATVHCKGHFVGTLGELLDLDWEGQLVQGYGERLVDNRIKNRLGAFLAKDTQAVCELELVQDVQALNMVQMKVTEEEIDGQVIMDFTSPNTQIKPGITVQVVIKLT